MNSVWQLFSGAICATTLLNKTKTITWQLTLGQANHLGVTIETDIIKQKLPEYNHGYEAVAKASGKSYGKQMNGFTLIW